MTHPAGYEPMRPATGGNPETVLGHKALLHPIDALIQAGVRKRRAHQLIAALDRMGYKIVATSATVQRHGRYGGDPCDANCGCP